MTTIKLILFCFILSILIWLKDILENVENFGIYETNFIKTYKKGRFENWKNGTSNVCQNILQNKSVIYYSSLKLFGNLCKKKKKIEPMY